MGRSADHWRTGVTRLVLALGALLGAASPAATAEGEQAALAGKVKQILKTACYRCHGENGANEGGFNYLLDRERLAATKKIVAGDAAKSNLYKRLVSTDQPMPPDGEKPRPTAEEIALVKQWIEAGAPDFAPSTGRREFITPEAMLGFIAADLTKAAERDRRFLRYFTVTHLHNAGAAEDELQSHRIGLSKLINSLSWGRRVAPPQPIDPAKTVLRIDLRDYKWNEQVWDDILFLNPYGIFYGGGTERFCREATGTRMPHVRADWFVFAASRPPLYHDVLQLPKTERELEKTLQVDAAENIRQERVARAGFNGSGVSRNNRLLERHESAYGAYWKSYDFAGNSARKNLFAHPLGPNDEDDSFQHDGGELIFNLPNGLQAYLLVDAKGARIDKGPSEIVSDPKQGDRRVVNGVSCMSCHSRGMIDKADQVRDQVKKNAESFSKEEVATVMALYPEKSKFAELLREDAERFKKAVEKTGAPLSVTEPVVALALRFEMELDAKLVAAEIGLELKEFLARLEKNAALSRSFGALRVEGGTVQREVFVVGFPALVRDLNIGRFADQFRPQVAAASDPESAPTAKRPFNPGTLTVTVPKVGEDEKSHAFRIEVFLDKERDTWFHLCETGSFAVTAKTKDINSEGDIEGLYSIELQTRKPGETEFTEKTAKRSIAVKHDGWSDSLIYVSDAGSIAVVKAKKPAGKLKGFTHITDYGFNVRKADEREIGEETKAFLYEVYRDENTGLLLLLTADGALSVSAGDLKAATDIKYSPYPHGFVCKARKGGEAEFTDATAAHGIDLWPEPTIGLICASHIGSLAIVKGAVSDAPTVAPAWVRRYKLGVRAEGEGTLPDDDRLGSIEVFQDKNSGNLLYVGETGHVAVLPSR